MPGNHRRKSRASDQLRHLAGHGVPSYAIGGAQAYGGNTGQGAGSAYSGASNQQTSSSMASPSGGGGVSGGGTGTNAAGNQRTVRNADGSVTTMRRQQDNKGMWGPWQTVSTTPAPARAVNYSAAPPSQSTALSNTRAHEVGYGSGGGAPGPGGSFDRAGAYGGGGGIHPGHGGQMMHSYRFDYDYPVVQPYEMLGLMRPTPMPSFEPGYKPQADPWSRPTPSPRLPGMDVPPGSIPESGRGRKIGPPLGQPYGYGYNRGPYRRGPTQIH